MKLFPLLISFDENAEGAGRVVARSYVAFALGLFGLNCLRGGMYGGWRYSVKILTDHGTNLSMCIYGYWSENHLILEKITNDVIS